MFTYPAGCVGTSLVPTYAQQAGFRVSLLPGGGTALSLAELGVQGTTSHQQCSPGRAVAEPGTGAPPVRLGQGRKAQGRDTYPVMLTC